MVSPDVTNLMQQGASAGSDISFEPNVVAPSRNDSFLQQVEQPPKTKKMDSHQKLPHRLLSTPDQQVQQHLRAQQQLHQPQEQLLFQQQQQQQQLEQQQQSEQQFDAQTEDDESQIQLDQMRKQDKEEGDQMEEQQKLDEKNMLEVGVEVYLVNPPIRRYDPRNPGEPRVLFWVGLIRPFLSRAGCHKM